MPKQQTDFLIDLISRLTKAEKRSFRLFANRQNSNDEKLFMILFDFIDGNDAYNEEELLRKYPQVRKVQLSNIKANLYKQLLTNLRLLSRNTQEDINTRELIDFAKILHSKGMYRASLDVLYKAKNQAMSKDEYSLAYVALEFERQLENQYITGSMAEKAEEIEIESRALTKQLVFNDELANLSLRLYGLYLKYGYVKDKRDALYIKEFFNSHMPSDVNEKELNFYGKMYLYQSYVWYYNMMQDFANNYKFSHKWVELFESYPDKRLSETSSYIKALHNVLSATFMADRVDKFLFNYQKLLDFGADNQSRFSQNDESVYALVNYIHRLNHIFMTGEYRTGVTQLHDLEKSLETHLFGWDVNRTIVFYYKIACAYFGADNYSKAVDYLNKIINMPVADVRNDIQCFARILNLIAHYELGNKLLISYQVKSVFRFLSKMEEMQSVQREIFTFLRKTPSMIPDKLKTEFKVLRAKLVKYQDDPYEKRAFLYLDIIAWLDSKIKGIPIETVIQNNIKNASLTKTGI